MENFIDTNDVIYFIRVNIPREYDWPNSVVNFKYPKTKQARIKSN